MHVVGVVIVGEGKSVMSVEPSHVEMAAVFGFAYFNHDIFL